MSRYIDMGRGAAVLVVALAAMSARPAGQDVPIGAVRPPFDIWLADVRAEALARGLAPEVVAEALDGLAPLPVVVERDQTQAEFTVTLDGYLRRRLTPATRRTARRELARHRALLRTIEASHGVEASVLVSVWGLESNFGRFSGVRPTIAVLATLAYEPRRAAFFRGELFDALEILSRGDVEIADLKGSWAGAIGQPQFMPSSYLRFAVDFDRDGRKDIWSSPGDVFASIANYLGAHGWTRGERWGREVAIPKAARARVTALVVPRTEGCRAERQMSEPRPLNEWRQAGVTLKGGVRLPTSRLPASLVEIDGHAFLVYRNYEAVLAYNCAHPYALSVALLADSLAGR